MKKIKTISLLGLIVLFFNTLTAQKFDPAYIKVTNERAAKIVNKLELDNKEKEAKVSDIVAKQYRSLSAIQDPRDEEIDKIKKSYLSQEEKDKKIKKITDKADRQIAKKHKSYLKKLGKYLTDDQVGEIKNGMTYNVLNFTYDGYLDMLPELTQTQKDKIYNWLVEAREHAIDAGSSDKKHWWFGKYKGRINNYLSAEGYDLNKASQEWHERIEARKNEQD